MKLLAFALPDGGLKPMALEKIRRSKTRNDVLYADRQDVKVDGPAFVTGPPERAMASLKAAAIDMGAALRGETDAGLFFVWRSPVIGFPNGAYAYVSVQGDGSARVSLYGQALYGRQDFGANKAFIDRLAAAL